MRQRGYVSHDSRRRIPNWVSIDQQPAVVEKRSPIGNGEINPIIGRNHCATLVSLAERKSQLSRIGRRPNKCAEGVKPALIDWLSPLRKKVHLLTSDNGKEFAQHEWMAKNLEAKFFFTYPYA